MSATTQGTVGLPFEGQHAGASLLAAFTNPSSLDLLQVINEGGKIVWSLSSTGVVALNPASPTSEPLLARLQGSSFLNAIGFNPASLDILQIRNVGGNISFWLDSTGTAHGS